MNPFAAMKPLPDLHLVTQHVESLVIRLRDVGFQLLTYQVDGSDTGTAARLGRMVSAELLADTGMLVSLSGSDVGVVAGHLMVAAGPVREALGARQDETTLAAAVRVAAELADQVKEVGEQRTAARRHLTDLHFSLLGAQADVRPDASAATHALAAIVPGLADADLDRHAQDLADQLRVVNRELLRREEVAEADRKARGVAWCEYGDHEAPLAAIVDHPDVTACEPCVAADYERHQAATYGHTEHSPPGTVRGEVCTWQGTGAETLTDEDGIHCPRCESDVAELTLATAAPDFEAGPADDEHLTIDDEGAEGEGPVCRDMGGEG